MEILPLWFFVLFATLFGSVIGSFLNVVVYRVPAGVSLMGRSRCPKCDHAIREWHNVPVLGWLVLRGNCYDCHAPIAWRYPAVEAFTAAAFGAITWWNGPTAFLPTLLYFASISIALTLIDIDTLTLPDSITKTSWVIVAALIAAAAALTGSWQGLERAALAAGVVGGAYLLLWLVTLGLGLGFGDVKLAPVLGAVAGYLGWSQVIIGAAGAWALGGIVGIVGLATGRLRRGKKVPFGPFLIIGTWIGIFAGPFLWQAYLDAVGLS